MMRQYQLYRTRRNVLELKEKKKKVRIQLLHDDSTFAMQLSLRTKCKGDYILGYWLICK